MGATLLPVGVVTASQRASLLRMHPLPALRSRVETVFVRRADGALSPAMSQFLRQLRRADTPVMLRSVAP